MTARPSSIALLLEVIDEAFDRAAWHGPTLRGSLRGVTDAQAAWRPARGAHNIRDLTVHAAYWKHMVRSRLTGSAPAFALEGSDWFAASPARSWKEDVRLLVDEHKLLREAVAAYPPAALGKAIDRKKQTAAFSIRGIAAHDLYHAGQIQLLKRLQRK
jgi:hypothetical protein